MAATVRRVALVNPPGDGLHIRDLYCSVTSKGGYYWPPIDLLAASGTLRGRFELVVVDAMAEGLSAAQATARLEAFGPDAVVAMTGSSTWPGDMRWLRALKERTGCRVVVSGDVCLEPEARLLRDHPWLDALLTDFTTPTLADWLGDGGTAGGNGLTVRGADGVVRTLPRGGGELHIPTPVHELFPLRRYRLPYARRYPFSTVLTNFGCPFGCGYCIQARGVMGWRKRPVAEVLSELEYLKARGVREVYFRDPMFESDRRSALELCRAMTARGLGLSWSCNSRTDTLDDTLAAAMKAAGCYCIAFGFETSNDEVLKRFGKSPASVSRRAIETCRRHGIQVAGYWILGLPGETYESVQETIRFAAESGTDYASFSVPTPDYGTPLRRQAEQAGLIAAEERTFDRSGVGVSLNPNLSPAQLRELQAQALRRFYLRPGYVWGRLRSIRTAHQLKEAVRGGLTVLASWARLKAGLK